jgi:hypothetical protein
MLGCSHIFSLTISIEEWGFCHHAQEQEDDAMLLGAKFCSDTFANIPLDLAESNLEFCFYARFVSYTTFKLPLNCLCCWCFLESFLPTQT